MHRKMLAAAIALVTAGFAPAATPHYVPATGWQRSWSPPFHEKWFGGQLRAMHEPSFASSASLRGYHQRLRLLVLPTFRPGYVFRIDEASNHKVTMRWALLNGAGGYKPGQIAEQSERTLTPPEWHAVSDALTKANLSTVSQTEHIRIIPGEDGGIVVCADGTVYVIERRDHDDWLYVERSCQIDEAPVRRLIQTIMGLHPSPSEDDPGLE
jgi:hypothetical protein